MKPFNLEEYLKTPSRKVVTREGRPVRIICTDFNNINYPLIIEVKGLDVPLPTTREGRHISLSVEERFDLFFAPEKHEGWANVFKSSKGNNVINSDIFESKEEAEKAGKNYNNYVATAKVEWEE